MSPSIMVFADPIIPYACVFHISTCSVSFLFFSVAQIPKSIIGGFVHMVSRFISQQDLSGSYSWSNIRTDPACSIHPAQQKNILFVSVQLSQIQQRNQSDTG